MFLQGISYEKALDLISLNSFLNSYLFLGRGMQRSEDNFVESVLFFHLDMDQTQVTDKTCRAISPCALINRMVFGLKGYKMLLQGTGLSY